MENEHDGTTQYFGESSGAYDASPAGRYPREQPRPRADVPAETGQLSEDHKRTAERLAFHSFILRQVNDAVIAIDGNGAVTFVNCAAERLYGFTTEQAVGRPLRQLYEYRWIHATDEFEAAASLRRDGFWRGENIHITSDGRRLHVESSVSVLTDDTGRQVGLLAVIRDVTQSKRMEEALRDRQERMQRAFGIQTVGVLFFSLDGRITDANAAFERMSGYSRDELCTRIPWRSLTPPEFMDATTRAARELASTGETAPYEKQMIRKDGSRWWGLVAPKRIAGSGRDSECVEFILDISQAKQSAAALQELEERQRLALDAVALGTWKHHVRTGRIELDTRARAHYGVETAVVDLADISARIHPEDASLLQRAITAALDPAIKSPVQAEYRVVQPDGSTRWLSVHGQVRFDDDGGFERPTVGVGTTRDVTVHKRAEQALRDADRRKDEFLAILAHELRNPLAPIRTA